MKGQEKTTRPNSSCAACKFLKRKCTPNCTFAPYFRSNELHKFAKVHKVFGASNVSKILSEVPVERREDTVKSLVYEAEARLEDPVYGCIGALAILQNQMVQLQHDLAISKARLASFASSHPRRPLPFSPPLTSPLVNEDYYVDGSSSSTFVGYDGISSDQSTCYRNYSECQRYDGSSDACLPTSFPQ